MILKSPYFWVVTAIFAIIVGVSAIKFIPPGLSQLSASKAKLKELNSQITDEKQFAAAIDDLSKNKSELSDLANLSQEALPDRPDGEELSLQLDGMFNSLGLAGSTATVPYGSAPAGAGSSVLTVTVAGPYDFAQAKSLLSGLKQLIRWNKVTTFELSHNGNSSQFSASFTAFYKPGKVKTFSGNAKLLEQAQALLSTYHSYTTRPNAEVEGTYGRTDPFAP